MTAPRIALLVFGAAAVVFIGFIGGLIADYYLSREGFRALRSAGYGEIALRRAGHYCPLGDVTFTFIAQGGARGHRDGLENEGYVCAGFGGAWVYEAKLDPDDRPDWD
jgi:hypothetical protein